MARTDFGSAGPASRHAAGRPSPVTETVHVGTATQTPRSNRRACPLREAQAVRTGPDEPRGHLDPDAQAPIPDHVREGCGAQLERLARAEWATLAGRRGAFPGARTPTSMPSRAIPSRSSRPRPRGTMRSPAGLCRLGYLGGPERWAFAFYRYSDGTYEPSFPILGLVRGTPKEDLRLLDSGQVYLHV